MSDMEIIKKAKTLSAAERRARKLGEVTFDFSSSPTVQSYDVVDMDAPITRNEIKLAYNFIGKELAQKANKMAIDLGYIGSVDLKMKPGSGHLAIDSPYARALVHAFRTRNYASARGYMNYDDTINAVIRMVGILLTSDKHIAIKAPMQSGKTAIIVLGSMLYRTIQQANGVKVRNALIPYGRRGPSKEMLKDYEACWHTYHGIQDQRSDDEGDTLGDLNNSRRTFPEKGSNAIYSRNTQQQIDEYTNIANLEDADELVAYIDEADFASNENSQRGSSGSIGKLMARCDDLVNNEDLRVRLVLLSATAYEFDGLHEHFEQIEVRKLPGSGYRGVCQGDQLNICSLTDVGSALGLRDLQNDFDLGKNGIDRIQSVCKLIAGLFKGVRAPGLGLNGLPANGGRAIAIRFGSAAQTEALIKHWTTFYSHHEVRVVHHYEDNLTTDRGEPITIEEAMSGDIPCLIVVKGSARRADRFPAACALFLDFTKKYTTAESFYQGMIGRACGYKPDNIVVIVSDANMELVQATRDYFAETGEDEPQLPFARAVRVGRKVFRAKMRDRYVVHVNQLDAFSPGLGKVLKQNMALLPEHNLLRVHQIEKKRKTGEVTQTNVLTLKRPSEGYKSPLPDLLVNDEKVGAFRVNYMALFGDRFDEIEGYLSERLGNTVVCLKPGSTTRPDKRALDTDSNGFIRINMANVDRSNHGGSDSSNRDDRRNTPRLRGKGDSANDVRPELLYRFRRDDAGDWTFEPIGIQIFFDGKSVKDVSEARNGVATLNLPSNRSAYARFRTRAGTATLSAISKKPVAHTTLNTF